MRTKQCLIVWKNNDIRRLDVSTYWIDDDTVYVKKTVKDLGVIIDSTVSSKEQIAQVARTTGCHPRNISTVMKYFSYKT